MKWHKLLIVVGVWLTLFGYIGGYITLGLDQVTDLGMIRIPLLWICLIGVIAGPIIAVTGWTIRFLEPK